MKTYLSDKSWGTDYSEYLIEKIFSFSLFQIEDWPKFIFLKLNYLNNIL